MPIPLNTQIDTFIDRFTPELAKALRLARKKLQKLVPRGYELVYDNYNFLGFGYAWSAGNPGVVVSLVAYPRYLTLFFLQGAHLADPERLLSGKGSQVRSIRLTAASDIDNPAVRKLLEQALQTREAEFLQAPERSTVVKSVASKQRPRRPEY